MGMPACLGQKCSFFTTKSCLRNDDVVIEMHLSSAYCLKAHSDKEKWLNWNIMQRIGIASKALKQISPVIIAYEFQHKTQCGLKSNLSKFKIKKVHAFEKKISTSLHLS